MNFCPQCGNKRDVKINFCRKCDFRFEVSNEENFPIFSAQENSDPENANNLETPANRSQPQDAKIFKLFPIRANHRKLKDSFWFFLKVLVTQQILTMIIDNTRGLSMVHTLTGDIFPLLISLAVAVLILFWGYLVIWTPVLPPVEKPAFFNSPQADLEPQVKKFIDFDVELEPYSGHWFDPEYHYEKRIDSERIDSRIIICELIDGKMLKKTVKRSYCNPYLLGDYLGSASDLTWILLAIVLTAYDLFKSAGWYVILFASLILVRIFLPSDKRKGPANG